MHRFTVAGWERRKQKNFLVGSTNCCWHFSRVTQTDREYGLMSSSKIGLVKITCHESLHSSHDVEFLHSYQQSYTSTWDKLWSPQCIIWTNRNEVIRNVRTYIPLLGRQIHLRAGRTGKNNFLPLKMILVGKNKSYQPFENILKNTCTKLELSCEIFY